MAKYKTNFNNCHHEWVMLDQRNEGFSHVYFKNENLSHPWPILRHNLWSVTLHCSHMTCNPNELINHNNWPLTCDDQSCVTSYTFIIVLWVTHVTTGRTGLRGRGLHVLDSSGKQRDQLTVDSVQTKRKKKHSAFYYKNSVGNQLHQTCVKRTWIYEPCSSIHQLSGLSFASLFHSRISWILYLPMHSK